MLIRRDSCAGETKLQSNRVRCLNTEHKGEAWQLVSELILNPSLPQKCRGLMGEAGLPPGEEGVGVRGQLCRLPSVCLCKRKVCSDSALPRKGGSWGAQPQCL